MKTSAGKISNEVKICINPNQFFSKILNYQNLKFSFWKEQQMVKQRNEESDSVTQQGQSRDIYLKKSNKFTFRYNLSILFYSQSLNENSIQS